MNLVTHPPYCTHNLASSFQHLVMQKGQRQAENDMIAVKKYSIGQKQIERTITSKHKEQPK